MHHVSHLFSWPIHIAHIARFHMSAVAFPVLYHWHIHLWKCRSGKNHLPVSEKTLAFWARVLRYCYIVNRLRNIRRRRVTHRVLALWTDHTPPVVQQRDFFEHYKLDNAEVRKTALLGLRFSGGFFEHYFLAGRKLRERVIENYGAKWWILLLTFGVIQQRSQQKRDSVSYRIPEFFGCGERIWTSDLRVMSAFSTITTLPVKTITLSDFKYLGTWQLLKYQL